MDYKKLVKSRNVRLAILKCLSFIPDKMMLKLQYRIKLGRKLNLKDPQRFSEKLQWYKLYYKNPQMIPCVDKYDVREYVKAKGLGHILNECYGVYDRVEDIDFDKLPDKFVLKDTLGGGGNSVIIVKDKASMDKHKICDQMRKWVNNNHKIRDGGREWPYYSGKPHRIIIEKYIEADDSEGGLVDYKFFCFGGKAEYMYVISDRVLGEDASLGILDADYNLLDCTRLGKRKLTRTVPKPVNFSQMLAAAECLSAEFPHARIDFYNQNEELIFGEITFYNASGYVKYDPDEFDLELGEKFILPKV